jgi:hypothetical protein
LLKHESRCIFLVQGAYDSRGVEKEKIAGVMEGGVITITHTNSHLVGNTTQVITLTSRSTEVRALQKKRPTVFISVSFVFCALVCVSRAWLGKA